MPIRDETELNVTLLARELGVVMGRINRRLRAQHQRFGLTQAAVLGRLDRCGPQSIGQLASAERVRPQSMSQTLAELEAEGLVERSADENDGRRTMIALTGDGRTALSDDRALRDGWLSLSIATLSPAEQALLGDAVELLERLSEL